MSPTMGAPDWGQGLGREKEGRGDTCWAEDPVCFSTLALLPLTPQGTLWCVCVCGGRSGADDVPGMVGVYEVLG